MKRTLLFASLTSLFLFQPAHAGVSIGITFNAAPPVYEISPGVSVVEDYDDEVFFSGGYYWVARQGVWYHTHDYHGGWVVVDRQHVPVFVRDSPPGRYRHWKHEAKKEEHHDQKHEGHDKHGKHDKH